MFLFRYWNCLPLSLAASVVFLIGCGGSEDAEPVTNPAAESTESIADETPVADGSGEGTSELKREALKIEPYQGPAIFLDEPPPPPPPTIVGEKLNAPVEKYADGTVKIERQVTKYSDDRFVNDGLYREYFPNGQMFVEGSYTIGEKEGTWKHWHENGQLRRSTTYVAGKPDGSWEVYRAEGSLEAKRSFKAGLRDGEWLTYYDTDEVLKRRMPYQNGKPHGNWEEWFADGQQKTKADFANGLREGLAVEWDSEGNKRAEVHYQAGKLHGKVTRWALGGKVLVQEYANGKLQSEKVE